MSGSVLADVFAWLSAQPFPVYLVGGSLRQWLLDKPTKDYDFVVTKAATRLAYKLGDHFRASCFPLDKERDMARVVLGDTWFDFAPCGEDLNQDLMARDLSINAMACPVDKLGILHQTTDKATVSDFLLDPSEGLSDLKQGLVRGIAKANFEADPLRLLRIFRFAAKLDFTIEAETLEWACQLSPLLAHVAKERCLAELSQTLLVPSAAPWIQALIDQGLFRILLPFQVDVHSLACFESLSRDRPADPSPDIKAYLNEALNAERPRLFVFKLSTLLLGSQNGDRLSAAQASLEALTLSRREIDSLLKWERLLPQLAALDITDPVARFHLFRQTGNDVLGLYLLASIRQQRGCPLVPEAALSALLAEWRDPDSQVAHPRQLLDGRLLQQELDIRPGPQIGKLLLAIQEAQARGAVTNQAEAVAHARACLQSWSS